MPAGTKNAPAKAVKGTRAASLPPTTPPPNLLKRHALSCASILSEQLGFYCTKFGCGALCGASPGARCQVAKLPTSPARVGLLNALDHPDGFGLGFGFGTRPALADKQNIATAPVTAECKLGRVTCSSLQTSHHFPVGCCEFGPPKTTCVQLPFLLLCSCHLVHCTQHKAWCVKREGRWDREATLHTGTVVRNAKGAPPTVGGGRSRRDARSQLTPL